MSKKDDSDAKAAETAANKRRSTREGATRAAPTRGGRGSSDIAFVEALAKVLRDNDLAEIEVTREFGEDDEMTVRLSRYLPSQALSLPSPPPALGPPVHAATGAQAPAEAEAPSDPKEHPGCVASPMVGTVYLAAEPGAPNFVQIGDTVESGQTLLIVEAMKTMNHIPSPKSGRVMEILVADGQPVEYGAPLVVLE